MSPPPNKRSAQQPGQRPAQKPGQRPAQKPGQRSAKKAAGAPSGKQRLQRLLASAGFGSRRQCEELVESGRVEVDGQNVTKLGTTVDPSVNKIRVDGVPLRKQKLVYYAVNKPVGFVTTNADPQGRARVIELVPRSERVFPVGRLDLNSEGLILLTNDGELAQRLSHPKFGVQKIYRVTVAGKVEGETMKQMRQGIYIAEGHVQVEGARILKSRAKSTELEIVLREGKNREIRRILARLGHKVQHLRRIAVGPLRLGDLPSGAYRPLHYTEVQKLQALVEESAAAAGQSGTDAGERARRKQGKRAAKKRVGSRPLGTRKKAKTAGKSSPARATVVLDRPSRGSAVIGGDTPTADELTKSKKRAAKKTAKKAGGKRGGGKKSTRSRAASSGRGSSGGGRGGSGGAKKSGKNPRHKQRSTKKRKRS